MYLILNIHPHCEPDYTAAYTDDHQPRPIEVDVLVKDANWSTTGALRTYIRPEDWEIPKNDEISSRVARQSGVSGASVMPFITGPGGAMSSAMYVICYDFKRTDHLMRCWRVSLNCREWDWVPQRRQTVDLVDSATAASKADKPLSLDEAYRRLCDDGVTDFNRTQQVAELYLKLKVMKLIQV